MENIKKIDLSIVLSTKNEGDNLELIIPKLIHHSDDIILVDGHSNDGTKEICEKYNIKFLLDNKIGKGDAQKIGLKEEDVLQEGHYKKIGEDCGIQVIYAAYEKNAWNGFFQLEFR